MAETNMCNRFDFISNGRVVYKGTQFTEYEEVEQPKPDEPEEKKFDGSSLTGKVLGAVAAAGCVAAAFGLVAAWGASVAFSGGAAFAAAPLAWQGFAFLMAAAPIAMEAGNAISEQYNQDMANQKDSGWGTYAKISIVDPVKVGARDSAIGLIGGAAAAKLIGAGSKLMGKMFKPRVKYASTYQQRLNQTPKDGSKGKWTGKRGESTYKSTDPKANQILQDNNVDGVGYREAVPDFSPVSKGTVKIDGMTNNRVKNFDKADAKLAKKRGVTPKEIKKWRAENELTWHECNDRQTMQVVSSKINGTFGHLGGVGEINAIAKQP